MPEAKETFLGETLGKVKGSSSQREFFLNHKNIMVGQ